MCAKCAEPVYENSHVQLYGLTRIWRNSKCEWGLDRGRSKQNERNDFVCVGKIVSTKCCLQPERLPAFWNVNLVQSALDATLVIRVFVDTSNRNLHAVRDVHLRLASPRGKKNTLWEYQSNVSNPRVVKRLFHLRKTPEFFVQII